MNASNLPIIKSLVFFLALYSQQFVAEENQKELQRIGQTAKRKPQAGELKVVKVEGEANFEIGDNSNLISEGVVILPGSRITSKRGARVFVKNPLIGVFCIMENSSLSFGKIIITKDTPEPARKLDIDLRDGSILGILNGSINQSIISCEISYPSGIVVVESLDFGSTFYLNENEDIRIITSNEDNNPFEFLDKDISAVNQAYENLKPFQHKFPQNKNKLISAILSNDFAMAATLIENGEDINKATADGITPLMIAGYENRTELVNYMLSMGGDPNVSDLRGFTPLHVACEYGNNQIAKSLIDRGADINALDEEGWTPLLQAVDKQNAATVHLLTQKGANVNTGLTDGHSSLHAACGQGTWEIAKILIEAGADVNKATNDGLTPLMLATWSDNEEIVSFLLKIGANPNVSDEHGFSPLHHAAHLDNKTIINLLLNAGAEVDARTKDNDTPLWVAAWNGNHKSTDLLIEKGADVNAIGITGLTILSQVIGIRRDPSHLPEKKWQLVERSLRKNGAKETVN